MTLRPIDLQVMVPKTTEMAKIQQVAKQDSDTSQSLLVAQFNNQLQMAKQKVTKRDKTEGVKIDKENSSKNSRHGSKKQRKGQKRKKPPSAKRRIRNSHIDIKI